MTVDQAQRPGHVLSADAPPAPPSSPASAPSGAVPRPRISLVLEEGRASRRYWKDLWEYRELLYFLSWRDVSVHYKQTLIGLAWAVIRPLSTMVIFAFIFGRVAKLPADGGVWYPLFVMAAMLPWQFFSTILGESSNSLVSNSNLISKVYFPRILVPLSSVGVPLVNLAVSLPFLAILMLFKGVVPPWQIVFAPLFILLAALAALGFGLLLCAVNVRYRDVRYVIPFIVQFGLFATPIGFSSSVLPHRFRLLFSLNPMVFVIDGLRWSFLGVGHPFAAGRWLLSLAVTAVALVLGVQYFRKTERTFADVI